MNPLVLAAALLAFVACTTPTTAPGPTDTAPGPGSEAIEDPDAVLVQVRVTRRDDTLRFATLWAVTDGNRTHRELVEGEGSEVVRTERPKDRVLLQVFAHTSTTSIQEAGAVMGRLLPLEVVSLDHGTRVIIGGGDGATLLPFQRVARSEEYDDWSVEPLPLFDGERAYMAGAVALADGRLVALLEAFSDDRPGRPAARHHGLWASRGQDWSAYTPMRPRFTPPLPENPDGWSTVVSLGASKAPDPVVWLTTWDHRVYVSTDGGETFRELYAR